MERGFQERVVEGGVGGWVVGQDKASAVSHGAPPYFSPPLLHFSRGARTVRGVRGLLDFAHKFVASTKSTRGSWQPPLYAAGGAILIALVALAARVSGLVITFTDSACPIGIYHLVQKPFARGELVESCLPGAIARYGIERKYLHSGDCPTGAEPVVKIIGALPGDLVELSREAVRVNGLTLATSASLTHDSRGREVHRIALGHYKTRPNEVWLFGLNDTRSWDSRYFGPIPKYFIRGTLEPVLTAPR